MKVSLPDQEPLDTAEQILPVDPARSLELCKQEIDAGVDGVRRARSLYLAGSALQRLERTDESLGHLVNALKIYESSDDKNGQVAVLTAIGRAQQTQGRLEAAIDSFAEALSITREVEDFEAEAQLLNLQAGALNAQGDYVTALTRLEEAEAGYKRLGLNERQAAVLSNIGILHYQLGDYGNALERLHAAYEIIKETAPGTRRQASNLIALGSVYREMGNQSKAQEFLLEARDVGKVAGDKEIEAAALNNLAAIREKDKDWDGARVMYQQALEIARLVGNQSYEIDNLDGLGQVYSATGDHHQAAKVHLEALSISREIGDREGENDALFGIGRGMCLAGLYDEAISWLTDALELARKLERRPTLYRTHKLLSEAFENSGDLKNALHHYREFYRVEKEVFNEENEERVRRLSVQFELDRARREAQAFRERTRVAQEAQEAAEAMVRERTKDLEEAQVEIVTRLAIAAEFRDDETGEHTWRVGRNAAAIARELDWEEADIKTLFAAARLHDVGKIGIRDAVLLKPTKLSDTEYEMMRRHTLIGGRILSGGKSKLLRMAEEIAFAHHERWDGKGYPLGLGGDEIPLSARIVAVADVFDALTHSRPYKRAWTQSEAVAEIRRASGRQFDPEVVEAFVRAVEGDGLETASAFGMGSDHSGEFVPSTIQMKDRLEQLLSERTRELEAARRDAEVTARKMEMMAFSDQLTGLGNQRAFLADLDAEVTRAIRQGDAVGVLTIDLDNMRDLNERQGHAAGDTIIRSFADSLQWEMQEMGRIYRTGGDEFTVILLHAQEDDVAVALERLDQVVSGMRAQGANGIDASYGVALMPIDGNNASDLSNVSSKRMYEQKATKKVSSGR